MTLRRPDEDAIVTAGDLAILYRLMRGEALDSVSLTGAAPGSF